MHNTHRWLIPRYGLETEGYKGAEMPAESGQWDTKGGKIGGVYWAFLRSAADGDYAAEMGGGTQERQEESDEADAGVVV